MSFFTFVLKNVLRRQSRSLLTALGVAIAVATTVSLLGIAERFESSMVETLAGRNIDIMVLEKDTPNQLNSDLDEALLDRIKIIPGVKNVDGGLVELVSFPLGSEGDQMSVMVQGWRHNSFLFDALKLQTGRLLKPEDELPGAPRVILLGSELARKLEKKVGDQLPLAEEQFEVIGIASSYTFYESNGAIAPLKQVQSLFIREGKITGCSLVLDKTQLPKDGAERICDEINSLQDASGKRYRLDAKPTAEFIKNSEHIRVSKAMARITSGVAMVVGIVSVLNTMIMTVMERVKEISILRAIGWPKGRVVRMVLGESVLLSIFGAAFGVAISYLSMQLIVRLDALNGFMDGRLAPWVVVFGVIMAMITGVVGGVYPAWVATKLLPSEGLRHE